MDEKTLIAEFKNNKDPLIYEQIYDQFVDGVFSRCFYILKDADLAAEATQDTMVKVYYALEKFESRSSLKTWIYRIASNHCFGLLRKKREVSYEELKEDGVQFRSSEDMLDTIMKADDMSSLLAELPKDVRGILMLKYMDGYSYDEIAQISGLSPSAIKMRIHRAKESLTNLKQHKSL
jgi:RNA polymerase sigma-70 factor (ECF subfamily)